MPSLVEYFLNSNSRVVQLELIELSHPAFSQTYNIVRNARKGVTVKIDGNDVFFQYYPLRITKQGSRADLDAGFNIDFGDLGEVIPKERDNIIAAGMTRIKATVRYWTFRSDDLTSPLVGPLTFEAKTFSNNFEGASFEARAPYVNNNRTGLVMTVSAFPMLRGFMK